MKIFNVIDNKDRIHIQLKDLKYICDFYNIPENIKFIFHQYLYQLEVGYEDTKFVTLHDKECINIIKSIEDILNYNEYYSEAIIDTKEELYTNLNLLFNAYNESRTNIQRLKKYSLILNYTRDVLAILFHKCGIKRTIFPNEIYYNSYVFKNERENSFLPIQETLDPNIWTINLENDNSIDNVDNLFLTGCELMHHFKNIAFSNDKVIRDFYINSKISEDGRSMDISYELSKSDYSMRK